MKLHPMILLLAMSVNAYCADVDTIYLDETYISGNQELPRVLYILPWKDQQGEAVPAKNPLLAMPDLFSPIYPHEYRLEMFYRALGERKSSSKQSSSSEQSSKDPSKDKPFRAEPKEG